MEQSTPPSHDLSQWMLRLFGGVMLLGVAVFGLASSCADTRVDPTGAEDLGAVVVQEPEVQRDLSEIRASGVLRILTRNNSSSYLVLRGEELGFDFELARAFAEELGVKLEVVLADSSSSMISMLNRGQGDLVAAPVVPTPSLQAAAVFSRPYNEIQPVLVVPQDYQHLYQSPEDLDGRMVAVQRWSNQQELLVDLRRQGIQVGMVLLPPHVSTEEILDMVAEGTYPAAVASSHVAQAVMSHRPELTTAFALGERQPVCWAVRKNSPELRAALDRFVLRHHRVDENGRVVGSELYNVLYHKYFLDERQIVRRAEDPFHVVKTGVLSPYDDLIRETAQRHDLDWLLVASVCFQESRWDPERESWAGAVGLMQVMPASHGVSPDSLRIPAVNLEVGVSHLRDLFDAYSYLPEEQQVRFALAAYNAGQGHVDDARILSIIREEDPNSWKSVRESLLLLRKPEWHRQVRYGYVRGSETVGYVREVLRRYDLFHEVREQANEEAWRRRPAAALSSAAR